MCVRLKARLLKVGKCLVMLYHLTDLLLFDFSFSYQTFFTTYL